jgi:hypothetical protein
VIWFCKHVQEVCFLLRIFLRVKHSRLNWCQAFGILLAVDNIMNEIRISWLFLLVLSLPIGSLANSESYAPINVTCPPTLIRSGENGLSPLESQYISQRQLKATESLQSWLELANLNDFNVTSFLANKSNVPILAIAFSGGGYRAMLNGAGVFQGMP